MRVRTLLVTALATGCVLAVDPRAIVRGLPRLVASLPFAEATARTQGDGSARAPDQVQVAATHAAQPPAHEHANAASPGANAASPGANAARLVVGVPPMLARDDVPFAVAAAQGDEFFGAPSDDAEGPRDAPDDDDSGDTNDDDAHDDDAHDDDTHDDGSNTADDDGNTADDGGAPAAGRAAVDHAEPRLVGLARETWVFAEPSYKSRRLGYLRAGSAVPREAKATTRRGCRGGWFRIEPEGYVCAGSRATTDVTHPIAALASRQPDRGQMPYLYGLTRYPTPPLYARIPTDDAQRAAEGDLERIRSGHRATAQKPDYFAPPPPSPLPSQLALHALAPGLAGERRSQEAVVLGQARVRSGFALLDTFEVAGRTFGLTTELALVPLDRLRIVRPSTLRGALLSDERPLPLAFVRGKKAMRYRKTPAGGLHAEERLAHRSTLALTGRTLVHRGESYYETLDDAVARAADLALALPFDEAPSWAKRGQKWIDVSILRQTLVAYEGTRPVFATLVSTGADGLEDHRESHATIQGTFLIHTKHVTVTMDGDERGDEFDLRDVPYVQYFAQGYALHAAYWHDEFGTPRSHGCVNLAPLDAAWLFSWTGPEVPRGWHAALSLNRGTIVHIHP